MMLCFVCVCVCVLSVFVDIMFELGNCHLFVLCHLLLKLFKDSLSDVSCAAVFASLDVMICAFIVSLVLFQLIL